MFYARKKEIEIKNKYYTYLYKIYKVTNPNYDLYFSTPLESFQEFLNLYIFFFFRFFSRFNHMDNS